MALVLNGSANTIGGIAVGGLPDGIVDTDMLAANAVATAKIADNAVTSAKATGLSPWTRNGAFSPVSEQSSEVVDRTIPSDCVEFSLVFDSISSAGNEDLCFQLGSAGGIVTSNYQSKTSYINNNSHPSSENITDMIRFKSNPSTGGSVNGYIDFHNVNSNVWIWYGVAGCNAVSDRGMFISGKVDVGATLTTLRCRFNGDSGFDAGTMRLSTRT